MRNIVYTIVIVLVTFWAIGFFVFSAGAMIHLLLILAIMFFLNKIISNLQVWLIRNHSAVTSINNPDEK